MCVNFSCEHGTISSVSPLELVCGRIGNKTSWLPFPFPVCHKNCNFPSIANANISFFDAEGKPGGRVVFEGSLIGHGKSVIVTCESGYNLTEKKTKILQSTFATLVCENGRWSSELECQPGKLQAGAF